MEPQPFAVSGQPGGRTGQHVLSVKGALTSTTAPAFLDAVLAVETPCLILDFSEVSYIDSSAIGVLVRAYVTCRKSKRRLALVGLNHRVANVLHITGIDPLFDAYPTLSEAEQGLA